MDKLAPFRVLDLCCSCKQSPFFINRHFWDNNIILIPEHTTKMTYMVHYTLQRHTILTGPIPSTFHRYSPNYYVLNTIFYAVGL